MRQVSLDDAAHILNLSRRTVQRRLADGSLTGQKVAGRWLVDVPDDTVISQEGDTGTVVALQAQVTQLSQERDGLARDRGEMARQIEALTGERDYLRSALAAALTLQQKALPAPRERPWWQFWKREEPGEG